MTEWTILVRRSTQITNNKYDPRQACFNGERYRPTSSVQRITEQVRPRTLNKVKEKCKIAKKITEPNTRQFRRKVAV